MRLATRHAKERFASLGDPPDCAPLLKTKEDLATCSAARSALAALKAAIERDAPAPEIIELAGDASLAAQRATQALRAEGLAKLLADHPAANPAPSASASARPVASASRLPRASARPKGPTPFVAEKAPTRVQKDPELELISSYARVATIALSELRVYLELAPLELRQRATSKLEALLHAEPTWAAMRQLVSEAALVEPDPELKRRLSAVQHELGPG